VMQSASLPEREQAVDIAVTNIFLMTLSPWEVCFPLGKSVLLRTQMRPPLR